MTVTVTQLPSFGTKLWREQHLAEKVYLERMFCCKIRFVERLCAQNLMDMLYAMEFGPENCKLSTYEQNQGFCILAMNSDGVLVFRTHPDCDWPIGDKTQDEF